MPFKNKTILVTGGSGSLGTELISQLLAMNPKMVISFSRNEDKQIALERRFNSDKVACVIGDVRELQTITSALKKYQVDYIFHLAALKHIQVCENQPQETIKTNVLGTLNLIESCINFNIKKFLFMSTDKAVSPNSAYGMSKSICERMVVQANNILSDSSFICVRSGNILGSNGSIVDFFKNQIKTKNQVTLTDYGMTRYFTTVPKVAEFLLTAMTDCVGGEIFIKRMKSFYISDLARVLIAHYGDESTEIKVVGLRDGERLNEALITKEEVDKTVSVGKEYFAVHPSIEIGRTYQPTIFRPDMKQALDSSWDTNSKEELATLLGEGGFLS